MKHRIILTYEMVMAIARDEANGNMRKNCRSSWNTEDWNSAVAKEQALAPFVGKAWL